MTFAEAVAFLDARVRWGIRPGTERIEALTEALGHPQRSCPVVHVSGTNGKFSVAAMVSSILEALGLTVGTYTSPHVESVRERIAIGGVPISEENFGAVLSYLAPYIEIVEGERDDHLTYFETNTAMAMEWFFDQAVHAAVLECGLGGEYDATNVADAQVAVITNVTLDHVAEFAGDVRKAAWEKAGIIKSGSRVVSGVVQPELAAIVAERAAERGTGEPLVLGTDLRAERRLAVGGQVVDVVTPRGRYRDLFVPLHGSHQADNAALAVAACEAFAQEALDVSSVQVGLGAVRAPGRLEVASRRPLVVLDGGHNPAAASAVLVGAREAFTYERLVLVLGMVGDKLVEEVASVWAGAADRYVVTSPGDSRAAPARRLVEALWGAGVPDESISTAEGVPEALDEALREAGPDDLVLVFGSFYTVGEARPWLRGEGLLSQD